MISRICPQRCIFIIKKLLSCVICGCLSIYLTVCVCMFVIQCVHAEIGTCFIINSPPLATSSSGTQDHMYWMQIHTLSKRKKNRRPLKSGCVCINCFAHAHTRENATEQKKVENVRKPQQSLPCDSRLVTVVNVVEGFGRELGTENRPFYGEKMQIFILMTLRMTILGHFELSHASTTILGLVHLFIFYVFPSNEAQERDAYSCFWP